MSWFTEEELAITEKGVVRVAILVELRFKSKTMYCWNGDTWLEANGRLWQPLHGHGMIDGIPVLGQGTAENLTLSLPGIDNATLALALAETDMVSQQLAIVYFQLFNDNWQTIGAPRPAFFGFMQPPRVSRSAFGVKEGSEQTISVECVNAFYNRSRPPFGRYTDADQKKRHPGDEFFSFVAGTVSKTVVYPDF